MLLSFFPGTGSISISQLLGDIPIAYPAYAVLLLIFIIFVYRITRAMVGEKFTYTRVFFTPALYSIFVIITFVNDSQYLVITGFAMTILGLIVGGILSRKVQVFQKKDRMYFKSSVIITVLWTFAFTGKILAELYDPTLGLVAGSSVFLTLTTGMLIAEAIVVYYKHSRAGSQLKPAR